MPPSGNLFRPNPKQPLRGTLLNAPQILTPRQQIETDFSIGGLIAKSYWDEYLFYFDPDTVLEQSKWEMGSIGKQQAEIILQYKKAEQPARLKMFKEENQWKVGLIETFGIERRDKPRW